MHLAGGRRRFPGRRCPAPPPWPGRRATTGRRRTFAVRGDQSGALRGEVELVQIRLGPIARLDGGDDPVGAVGDVRRPGGDADLRSRTPADQVSTGWPRYTCSGEVQRCPAERRPEPDQAGRPGPRSSGRTGPTDVRRVAPRGDEEVPGLAGLAAGGPRHGDGRGPKVAAWSRSDRRRWWWCRRMRCWRPRCWRTGDRAPGARHRWMPGAATRSPT